MLVLSGCTLSHLYANCICKLIVNWVITRSSNGARLEIEERKEKGMGQGKKQLVTLSLLTHMNTTTSRGNGTIVSDYGNKLL